MKPIRGGLLSVVVAAVLLLLLITATALAATGDLTQPAGTAGCISQTGAGPCADGHALGSANSVAVSADGKSVYVAAPSGNAVVRLNRSTTAGGIFQPAGAAGCISETGAGPCADGHGLYGPNSVAVSPDGKSVYVATGSDAVARFNRNTTTGAITQPAGTAGCVSETGAGPCADGRGLNTASSVAVSPDGKSVYVASRGTPQGYGSAVARFNRNTTTGAITQPAGAAGCVGPEDVGDTSCADGHGLYVARGVAVSADGRSVYVASSSGMARFNRNTTTGAIGQPAGTAGCISEYASAQCADGHGLGSPTSVTVSPDGKSVYVASQATSNAVARLNRNPTTGAITQPAGSAGCISATGAGPCANGHGLVDPASVAVSPDGKSVYVASWDSNPPGAGAVAHFNRDTTTGAITQPAGTAGCVSETGAGTCADGHGLVRPYSVAVSGDGKSVYVASIGTDAVARFNRAP